MSFEMRKCGVNLSTVQYSGISSFAEKEGSILLRCEQDPELG